MKVDWQGLADEADALASVKRSETDALEAEIAATLRNAGVRGATYERVMKLVSHHGLTAREWGVYRRDADQYALRGLDEAKKESRQAAELEHIDRHLHITTKAA